MKTLVILFSFITMISFSESTYAKNFLSNAGKKLSNDTKKISKTATKIVTKNPVAVMDKRIIKSSLNGASKVNNKVAEKVLGKPHHSNGKSPYQKMKEKIASKNSQQ